MANGPDLGAIDFTAPVVTGGGGRKAEARAIAEIGSVFGEARKETILQEGRADIDDAIDSVEASEADVVLDIPEGDPIIDNARDRLKKLQFARDQGTTSQQLKAKLEASRVLSTLQTEHPRLRQELAREFSSLLATDPEFLELGMQDARNTGFTKTAAADLKRIQDEAYGDVESGGLGLDPLQLPISDRRFVPAYLAAKADRQIIEDTQLMLGAKSARADVAAEEYFELYAQSLYGRSSSVNALLFEATAVADNVGKALLNPGRTGNAQLIQDWDLQGRDQMNRRVETAMVALEQDFLRIPVDIRGTPRFEEMRQMKDDTIAGLARLQAAVISDNGGLIQAWESEQAIRSIQFRESFPRLAELNLFTQESGRLIELWPTLGGEDTILKHQIGGLVQDGISGAMTRMFVNGGQDQIDPSASAQDIESALRRNHSMNDRPWGHAVNDDSTALESAHAVFETDYDTVLPYVTENSNPQFVQRSLNTLTTAMNEMSEIGRPPENSVNMVTSRLAGETSITAVNRAREGSVADSNSTVVLGQSALRFWDSRAGGDSARIDSYQRALSQSLGGGTSLGDVISFDGTNVEKQGQIGFVINEAAVRKQAARIAASRVTGVLGFTRTEPIERKLRTDATRLAQNLSSQMSDDLRAFGFILFAQNLQQAAPDYEDSFERAKFDLIFKDAIVPEGENGSTP